MLVPNAFTSSSSKRCKLGLGQTAQHETAFNEQSLGFNVGFEEWRSGRRKQDKTECRGSLAGLFHFEGFKLAHRETVVEIAL